MTSATEQSASPPKRSPTLPIDPPAWLTDVERQAYEAELYRIADEPIHRLLGHPDPVQNDPREGLILLLQVDSDDEVRRDATPAMRAQLACANGDPERRAY
jgi:hypothetical protein